MINSLADAPNSLPEVKIFRTSIMELYVQKRVSHTVNLETLLDFVYVVCDRCAELDEFKLLILDRKKLNEGWVDPATKTVSRPGTLPAPGAHPGRRAREREKKKQRKQETENGGDKNIDAPPAPSRAAGDGDRPPGTRLDWKSIGKDAQKRNGKR